MAQPGKNIRADTALLTGNSVLPGTIETAINVDDLANPEKRAYTVRLCSQTLANEHTINTRHHENL